MKNIQLLGLILVVVGSFMPLVHVPIVGNWNYWKLDHSLAIACWFFSVCTLFGILNGRKMAVRVLALLLIALFSFTLIAVKIQSQEYFSFLPFKSWRQSFAGVVKLKWGWFIEFSGAFILFFVKIRNK